MKIIPIDKSKARTTAGDLEAGDVFLRDECPRADLKSRRAHIVLWPHTRFQHLKQYQSTRKEVICVYLHNGKITSVDKCQSVLQLDADNVRLPIKEGCE